MNNRIAIVIAEFNKEITSALLSGCISQLEANGIDKNNLQIIKVPGAVEIPLVAKLLAKKNKADAIITLGAVIRGETGHYDFVCKQVSDGIQKVMLDFDIPVIFGVLTTDNTDQARDRIGGRKGHKGKYAADAALHMLNLVNTIV
jgi:6,7-dimethyl-8-ribityllumazine synthase